jgi:Toprim-like
MERRAMIPVLTRRGRRFLIISERDLDRPARSGKYSRAYCHIHGGDHTRSLALHDSGWGFCFNAACPAFSASFEATVLVAEWNPEAAENLQRWNQLGVAQGLVPPPAPGAFKRTQAARAAHDEPGEPRLPPTEPPQWQQDELQVLYRVYDSGFLKAGLRQGLARAYLDARGTPLRIAEMTGMGYLPPYEQLPREVRWDGQLRIPPWWCNRIIFPVGVWWPDATTRLGFCGRSLVGWQPGMSDQRHKEVLEQADMPRRWLKTWPHGWFGYELEGLGSWVLLVEGPFDRCALLAAGFHPAEAIALVGTGARAYWLPQCVRTVVLALDGDAGGDQATAQLAEHLERDGRTVKSVPPPRDGLGKDWSERWSRHGVRGVLPVLAERNQLRTTGATDN